MSDLYKKVGKEIRAARDKLGYTQEQLASLSHIRRPTVANIESGAQSVSLLQLFQLANALNVSPTALLPENSSIESETNRNPASGKLDKLKSSANKRIVKALLEKHREQNRQKG
jgi:transcriptional regulator with XRE-family HTH domain